MVVSDIVFELILFHFNELHNHQDNQMMKLVYIFLKNKKGGFFAQAVSTWSIYFKLPKVHNIGTGPVVQSSSNIC